MKRLQVLYTGNSCRSQMAEGWTRHLKAGQIEPYSAGNAPPSRGIRRSSTWGPPPALAASAADETEALDVYRRVRDEIRRFVEAMPENLSIRRRATFLA